MLIWSNRALYPEIRNEKHRCRSEILGYRGRIRALTYSPDSTTLLTGCGDETIELWRTDTYRLKSTIKPHTERVEVLRFSSDRRTLATGSSDRTILLWHWASIAEKKDDWATSNQQPTHFLLSLAKFPNSLPHSVSTVCNGYPHPSVTLEEAFIANSHFLMTDRRLPKTDNQKFFIDKNSLFCYVFQ